MHHEIVGPEITVVTGQTRLPKTEAIARHIAQYETRSMGLHSVVREEPKRDTAEELKATQIRIQLDAFELARGDFQGEHLVQKNLEELGIPRALAENWVKRNQVEHLRKIQKAAKPNVFIPSLEKLDVDKLGFEMESMLKVLNLADPVTRIIRALE